MGRGRGRYAEELGGVGDWWDSYEGSRVIPRTWSREPSTRLNIDLYPQDYPKEWVIMINKVRPLPEASPFFAGKKVLHNPHSIYTSRAGYPDC